MFSLYLNLLQEKYEEILRERTTSQSYIDQCETYYQAARGEKKRRYRVLDLKQKLTTGRIFVPYHL